MVLPQPDGPDQDHELAVGSLPSAYPAIVPKMSTSAVATSVTITELMKYWPKSYWLKAWE